MEVGRHEHGGSLTSLKCNVSWKFRGDRITANAEASTHGQWAGCVEDAYRMSEVGQHKVGEAGQLNMQDPILMSTLSPSLVGQAK
eukprot:512341-Pelagomonas_calceolata.AAC.1